MLSARTQEIRAKEGRSPNSRAHLPLVTRVSRTKSFATCQIKSRDSQGGGGGGGRPFFFFFFFLGGGGPSITDTPHSDISDIFCLSTIIKD